MTPSRWIVPALCCLGLLAGCGGEEKIDPCQALLPGDLVLSEAMIDPDGSDTGQEWMEVYNASDKDIDLKGITLYVSAPDGSKEKSHILPSGSIAKGAYWVAGDARGELPSYETYSYGANLGSMGNTSGLIGLRCGAKTLDEITYTNAPSGAALQLDGTLVPDSSNNDDAANFCPATRPLPEGTGFGTPGKRNDPCGGVGGVCLDENGQEREIVSPPPGALVISEVMASSGAVPDADGEWFEVAALDDFDLNGLTVQAGTQKTVLASDSCIHVAKDGFAVLAKSDDPTVNGGIPSVLATFKGSLTNSGGSIAISAGDTVLDQVSWSSSQKGTASQLDPSKTDADANDDPSNFCLATEPFGDGDLGTPGAANTACPVVAPAGQCKDGDAYRAAVLPTEGQLVITEFMADPSAVADTAGEWLEVKSTADVDLNGLTLNVIGSTGSTTSTPLGGDTCLHLAAGEHAVFAKSLDPSANGGLPSVTAVFSGSLGNGTASVQIKNGDALIDEVHWTSSTSGVASQLDPDKTDAASNDDPANFCQATPTYGAGDKGTPGEDNPPCGGTTEPTGQCHDTQTSTMRDPVAPTSGQLRITEVQADPTGGINDTDGEWFEVKALADVDLNGLSLLSGSKSATLTSDDCLHLASGSYAVFAPKADTALNDGLTVFQAISMSLANGGGTVTLKMGDTPIDAYTFPAATAGVSIQSDPADLDTFCAATADYGTHGNKGTPGAANASCSP